MHEAKLINNVLQRLLDGRTRCKNNSGTMPKSAFYDHQTQFECDQLTRRLAHCLGRNVGGGCITVLMGRVLQRKLRNEGMR